jgi:hypothetical protein
MNFLLFIFVLLISNQSIEEKPGSIEGSVLDSTDQKPLGGVIVEVLNTDKKTITDIDGKFEIQMLFPGIYDLNILVVRYKPLKLENIEVKSGEATTLQISIVKFEHEKTFTLDVNSSSNNSTHYYLKIVKPDLTIDYKILVLEPDPNVDFKILESKLNSNKDAVIDVLVPKE